jgi:hypothetical protein
VVLEGKAPYLGVAGVASDVEDAEWQEGAAEEEREGRGGSGAEAVLVVARGTQHWVIKPEVPSKYRVSLRPSRRPVCGEKARRLARQLAGRLVALVPSSGLSLEPGLAQVYSLWIPSNRFSGTVVYIVAYRKQGLLCLRAFEDLDEAARFASSLPRGAKPVKEPLA